MSASINNHSAPEHQHLKNKFALNVDYSDFYDPVSSRRAAVLVGLFQKDDEWHVLLTQRSSRLNSHSGEVCLPGGKVDGNETNIQAALRESQEEVGLQQHHVTQILGELPPRLSAHLLSVTPIVCIIAPPILKNKRQTRSSYRKQDDNIDDNDKFVVTPNPQEVESVFFVPLRFFLETSHSYSFYDYTTFYNHVVRIHEFSHTFQGRNYTIWGLTAHILIDAAQQVYGNTASNLIELDPPGLPRHTDLKVVETSNDDEEEHRIVVAVRADG